MAGPICWYREGELQVLWTPNSRCPPNVVMFSTDDKPEFVYNPFNRGRDYGPLDLSATVRYCRWVDFLVQSHRNHKILAHVTVDQPVECWSNTVTLCGAYLVLAKGYSASAAIEPFAQLPLPHFLDCRGEAAGVFEDAKEPDFRLRVIDVLTGLQHARDLGWLDYRSFNVEAHTTMLRPEHGDMTWLLPGKALAMASPWARSYDLDNLTVLTPEDLVHFFHLNKVGIVVQCNHPEVEEKGERQQLLQYDPTRFQNGGIRHVWLPFEDGGCPSIELLQLFLATCESSSSCFAVHCRSGLGRTGTLIGAFAIRHFGFTARSFIGWSRVSRPGTVHGNQQQYLANLEPYLRMGAPKALSSLDSAEQLRLLPKRELRFFALDAGISKDQLDQKSDEDVIRMILEARQAPPAAPPDLDRRAPDPALQRTGGTVTPQSPASGGSDSGDLWSQVRKYLSLLSKDPGWQNLCDMVQQLQLLTSGEAGSVSRFQSRSSQDPAEAERLRERQQQTVERSGELQEELQQVMQDLHSVQRDCSQLRLNIAKGHGEVEVEAAATVATAEAEEKLRQLKLRKVQLLEEREKEQLRLQSAKQKLNQPWESAKYSLDRLRSRLQVS